MRALATLGILSSLVLAGCLDDALAVKVNADGSGTITETLTMKTAAIERMKEMAKAFGGEGGKEPELFTEAQAKEKAAKMGEGVELASYEKLKTADGEGMKAVYKFKDITKVKIGSQPDMPGGGGGGLRAQTKSEPFTFKLARSGDNVVVTVVNPVKAPAEGGATPPAGQDVDEAQLAMVKEMFGGFKLSISVEGAGKLVKTNSPHSKDGKVTLLEMDFDKMFADVEKVKKLVASPPKSFEDAKALLKDFPGVKVSLDPEVTIEFAP